MKPIYFTDEKHAALKEYAKANGLKLEFLAEMMASKFLESLNEKTESKPVEIVNVKQHIETVQTVEVVTPTRLESHTKGMTLFANSPYFDIDLLTEKLHEQPRFKRFMPIDVQKLYDTLYSWSESKFEKRKDWLSVAFTFLTKSKGTEFKPTNNGIPMNKRDLELLNWMNRD